VVNFASDEIGLSLAKSVSGAGFTGEITSNYPELTSFAGPYEVFIVATPLRVVLALKNGAGAVKVLVACSLDYRMIDFVSAGTNSLNLANLQNNNQCVFQLGDESNGRVLYAGNIGNAAVFDQPLVLDYLTTDLTDRANLQGDPDRQPVSVVIGGSAENFQGVLSGLLLTNNTIFFHTDRGVDLASNVFRCFRDNTLGRAILAKEVN
jgi:hypothetical protein